MAGTLTDTTGWQVVVPIKPALDLTGSRLTATLADRFGGAVVALDSTVLVPGYDEARQIDWTAVLRLLQARHVRDPTAYTQRLTR